MGAEPTHPLWTPRPRCGWLAGVQHVTSADGTAIAVHRSGSGRPVVIVNGALSTAADASAIADAIAARGFEAVTFDRRARGDSGDATEGQRQAPFEPEREADDLAAVIEAVGGRAIVFGHSSGALLALLTASRLGSNEAAGADGITIGHLFLSEPPMRFGQDEPAGDLADRLQALVDEGRGGDAVVLFQREAVGLPEPMIEQIRSAPFFAQLSTLAQSTVYDTLISAATSTPTERMLSVAVPTTVLLGADTFPVLERAAPMLVEMMPAAELVRVPESRGHGVDPAATAAIIAERAGG